MTQDVGEVLGADGPFVDQLPGFAVRPQQQEMAQRIADTFAAQGILVCEAGTGTGKTLAYLVPALTAGVRTILSTATKTLQDQLFHRDLPVVQQALKRRIDIALLKGRQNYLCLHRLSGIDNGLFPEPLQPGVLEMLTDWSRQTESGDLEEVTALADDSALRPRVTSTTDNCLGQDCPVFEKCFVVKARRRAAAAEVVVVNHHLLFADLVLRETGFAELLPNADAVVLDEAHKIPDIASNFFSRSISGHQLSSLVRDGLKAAALEAPDMPDLTDRLRQLDIAQSEMRRVLNGFGARPDWRQISQQAGVSSTTEALGTALAAAHEALEVAAERGVELDSCYRRLANLANTWSLFEVESEREHIHWVDISNRNFTFYDTPISVAQEFSQRVRQSEAAWVLTSATIAVDGDFAHFCESLGIEDADSAIWESPFDYAENALLYVPQLAIEPGNRGYESALFESCLPLLKANRGRAFILCTSYRAMHALADLCRADGSFTVLVQGDGPRTEMLNRFTDSSHAVLVGTASFWEGVDVRGQGLSLVIIDKLPFAVPDDPVTKARAEMMERDGRNPFMEMQLPQAVTALKQGAGRLIRDGADRGALVIGDNRILTRRYGTSFVRSLPPMPLTTEAARALDFVDALNVD